MGYSGHFIVCYVWEMRIQAYDDSDCDGGDDGDGDGGDDDDDDFDKVFSNNYDYSKLEVLNILKPSIFGPDFFARSSSSPLRPSPVSIFE